MNVMTDLLEARAFAKNMAASLADTAYWANWHLLDISGEPPLDWIKQAKLSTLVRAKLPVGEGSILWLDGAVLAVFQHEGAIDLADFRETAEKTMGDEQKITCALLRVAQEAEKVKALLLLRKGEEPKSRETPPASYTFLKSLVPNIEDLLRDWHQNKKAREERKKPHILVVDDDSMVLRLSTRALGQEYEVLTAQSGAEAIAKHLQHRPDIIFLDIGLPDCDGLTLLNYMQQYDPDCRIVMFSADDFLKTRVRAFAGGAKAFLPKPFNLRAFQGQIAHWFSGKGQEEG